MELGRENPGNSHEEFCMTVLGAEALAARQCRFRAAWRSVARDVDRPVSGQAGRRRAHRPHHQRRARADVAGAADVPPLRPPSRDRLARAQRRGRIWEGIENVDDGELWETHLSLKSRLLEFVRRRAVEQGRASRRTAGKFAQSSAACSVRMRSPSDLRAASPLTSAPT